MRRLALPTVAFTIIMLQACADAKISAPDGSGELPGPITTKELSVEVCGFGHDFEIEFTNPYAPFHVGTEWSYEGEEDGMFVELLIEVRSQTERMGQGSEGFLARVVKETEWADGVLLEESWNYFAETADGTVCYFGEDVDIYEYDDAGELVDVTHEGAWRADEGENYPGIFMPADPQSGLVFQMEGAPDIAEDMGKVLGTGPVKIGDLAYLNAIRIRESNPLEGDWGIKYYAPGIGLLIDGPLSLVDFRPGGN